jgi:putative endonuclease
VNIIHLIRERIFGIREKRISEDSTRAERGTFGEDLAADYCRRTLGYKLIVRNWRYKRDEVDIICRDGEVLVFVEVRARSENALVSGFHSVDRHKKEVLRRGYKNYLKQLHNPPKHFRFDIIDVAISNSGSGDVRHYANVPLFSKHYQAQKPLSYD